MKRRFTQKQVNTLLAAQKRRLKKAFTKKLREKEIERNQVNVVCTRDDGNVIPSTTTVEGRSIICIFDDPEHCHSGDTINMEFTYEEPRSIRRHI